VCVENEKKFLKTSACRFALNIAQKRLVLASARTRWGSQHRFPDPLAGLRGGNGDKGRGKEWMKKKGRGGYKVAIPVL